MPESAGWTITTLKEHLEDNLCAMKKLYDEKIMSLENKLGERDRALLLQAEEYKRRMTDLNNENGRILAAQATSVSKDTWDGFIIGFESWKSATEKIIQAALPRVEFQAYKDATDKALTLGAGKSTGIGLTANIVAQVLWAGASIAAIVGLLIVVMQK